METVLLTEKRIIGIKKLLGSDYLRVNKTLLKIVGRDAAIWIADVFSKFTYFEKKDMLDEEGAFFNTQANIQQDTQLTPFEQSAVVKKLKEMNIITVDKKGLPSKNYYKFNFDVLLDLISTTQEIDQDNSQPFTNTMAGDIDEKLLYNKLKDNKLKDNNNSSKELLYDFSEKSHTLDNQPSIDNATLIRQQAKAKVKENKSIIAKPLNGPYKKVFDYWQMSGFPNPKTETKTYGKNVLALKSLMNEHKYTIVQIVQAIDHLKLAISPDYAPANLRTKAYYKKLYFHEFVLNKITGQCLFQELLVNPPKLLKNSVKLVPDPNPEITNFLKTFYVEKILGNATTELTVADENALRIATKKLINFHTNNQGKFPTPWFGVGDVARMYTDAIMDFLDRQKNGEVRSWHIHSFQWDDFFNKNLPAYMFDNAMLVKPYNPSPLNM